MPKSKFPKKIDTSIELPAVRDNILEVGSDVINSLRSAIFNIERVLGLNPQGAVGNSVAQRLSKSLDGNGNLKPEALEQVNVLSGPILNSDVSSVAAIEESKLKLSYPTSLLQSQISVLNTNLDTLIAQAEELSLTLSIHINKDAVNRHPATAISVNSVISVGDDVSTQDLVDGSVQSSLSSIYSSHINYTGADISQENNSHLANQIWFDNNNVQAIIDSNDVQEAIEDLALVAVSSQIDHQEHQHANGLLKSGVLSSADNPGYGNVLAENFSISFNGSAGSASETTLIQVNDLIPLGDFNLEKSDILTITDPTSSGSINAGDYQIESFSISSGNLVSLRIWGKLAQDSTSQTSARISKSIKSNTNPASLLVSAREEASLTSARSVQVANPNAVSIISLDCRPSQITTNNRFIDISIDSAAPITLDLYDGSKSVQSLDSIVSRINEQCSENSLPILSYRVDYPNSASQIAIVHNLPDEPGELHTLLVSQSTDNAIVASGFSSFQDQVISSSFGSNYYIEGSKWEGLASVIDTTELSFSSSANTISSFAGDFNFLSLGVKLDDIITISNANNSSDNGTYTIVNVSEDQLTLDVGQLPSGFAGSSNDLTRFRIFSNISSFNNLVFSEVSSSFGAALLDVFLSPNRRVFFDKRFEYRPPISGNTSLVTLVDFDGDVSGKTFSLIISEETNSVSLSLDGGEALSVSGNNNYVWVRSGIEPVRLKLAIPSVDGLNNQIAISGSQIQIEFFGSSGANQDVNLPLSRIPFDNFRGRVSGGVESSPRAFSLLPKGNVSINEISDSAINLVSERPLDELRYNGVVRGLEVTNLTTTSDLYTFDVTEGVAYINGKRIHLDSQQAIVSSIDSTSVDKIFIAVTSDGEIRVEPALPNCLNPINLENNAILHSIEFDGSTLYQNDLRLFIDHLDLKYLNAITVSPQPGMAHFSDLGKAIKYAKRFSQLFPQAGTPSIHLKSGDYNLFIEIDNSSITFATWDALTDSQKLTQLVDSYISSGFVLDFPVNIVGEGSSSNLILRSRYIFSDITQDVRGQLIIPGNGFSSHNGPLDLFNSSNITLRDFSLNNSRIFMPDMNIDDAGDLLNFSINLESLFFTQRAFPNNPIDNSIGSMCLDFREIDDVATNKGNLHVNNCYFIMPNNPQGSSVVQFSDPTRLKNLTFTNNKIMGALESNDCSLFSHDILTFNNADSGSNITLLGNSALTNFDSDRSVRFPMFAGGNQWGDRSGRDLRLGDRLIVGSDATIGGSLSLGSSLTATGYEYVSPLSFERCIFMDQISDPAMGSTSSNAANFANKTVNGVDWRTIRFNNISTGIEFGRIRLDVRPGQTLTSLRIFTSSDGGFYSNYFAEILGQNYFGVEASFANLGVGTLASPVNNISSTTYSNISVVGAAGQNLFVEFRRITPTGFNEDFHYLCYTVEADSVEAIGGLS